ncbi:MAG: DUF1343 domain-containing protein [Leptospiraceae bacterium]|nr:DUF1343 domain-containing protein [Leptospiraceae bacterium]MDW7976610.1 DUF1343 domain-containing protein [Leptospiraceae bacterium]
MFEYISSLERFLVNSKKIIPKNANLGLVANQVSFSFYFTKYSFEILNPKKVFLLEHGFFSELQDQIPITSKSIYQKYSDIQWISLYGETFDSLKPQKRDLEDLDVLVVDIQDVGSRYYTFLTSVLYILQAIVDYQLRIKIIVLDRINPTFHNNKRSFEGTPLQKKFVSFVGVEGILHRHGLTPAELLFYYWINIKNRNQSEFLFVPYHKEVPIQKLYPEREIILEDKEDKRIIRFSQNPFDIYPSPNMPTTTTAKVYTGQCLLEGTNLSEGRGTTKPFEIFGAPFIDKKIQEKISNSIEFQKLGVVLRPMTFIPNYHKFKNEICHGWQIHITDEKKYHSLFTTLLILRYLHKWTKDFDWFRGVYEFRSEYLAVLYLLGDEELFRFVESDKVSPNDLFSYLKKHEHVWKTKVKKFFLYGERFSKRSN